MKQNLLKGVTAMKSGSTWKRVGGVALGSLAAGICTAVASKITPDTIGRTGKYAFGGILSAGVTIGCFGLGFENAGIGAAMITVNNALNTATTLIVDKSVSELITPVN